MSSFLQVASVTELRHTLLHSDPSSGTTRQRREVLTAIHRAGDAFAAFWYRHLPEHVHEERVRVGRLRSIRADSLETANLSKLLTRDAYVSINGFSGAGTRKQEHLRRLNACWVDLDCRKTMMWPDAVEAVCSLLTTGVIPPPTFIVRSGKGLWLLWLLVTDDEDDTPPAATWTNRRAQRTVNKAVAATILHNAPELNADLIATDGARSIRMPGSVNTGSAGSYYVQFIELLDGDGARRFYSLGELESFFGCSTACDSDAAGAAAPEMPRPKSTRRSPAYRQNWLQLWQDRLDDFEAIRAARGGFSGGHRNEAVFLFALMSRRLKCHGQMLRDSVLRLAADCRPALPESEALQALQSACANNYRISNRMLAEKLGITVHEANDLRLVHIRPDFTPKRTPKGRNEQRRHRQRELRGLISAAPDASIRSLCLRLGELGIPAAPSTVMRDLQMIRRPTAEVEANSCQENSYFSLPP